MTDQQELDRLPWPKAADVIDELGWIQGDMRNERGVCLTGAIRECAPVPGDWAIVAQVAGHRKHAESWNDTKGRTKKQVVTWLRGAEPITDEELLEVFGPQWEHVVALVRRFAGATPEEQARYYDAVRAVWSTSAWSTAWRAVVVYGGPGGAARRALRAVGVSVAFVGPALARRHEIGAPGGIRQEDYDILTGPWTSVFGAAHPDDALVAA